MNESMVEGFKKSIWKKIIYNHIAFTDMKIKIISLIRNATKIQCIDQIKFKYLIRRQGRIIQQIIPKMQRKNDFAII